MTTRTLLQPDFTNRREASCPCGQQYYRLAKVAFMFDVSEKTLRL